MTQHGHLRKILPLILIFGLANFHLEAKPPNNIPAPDPLFQTISSLDAELFDGYNRCDLPKFGALLADHIEFYHDNNGLIMGKQAVVESVQKFICGKVTRELIPGTLEVYPLDDYGALEVGVHRFHHAGEDPIHPVGVGEAKFFHIWRNHGGQWQIVRVISYAHRTLPTQAGYGAEVALPNVSGKWIGDFDVTAPDGKVHRDIAFLMLNQDASKLSGSAGPTEHQQSPITGGDINGRAIHFTIASGPGKFVNFNLRLDDGRLQGEATGSMFEPGSRIAVEVSPIKPQSERMDGDGEVLYNQIAGMDAKLFDAYNSRDFGTLQSCFAKDLEFYHDKDGLSRYQQSMASFQKTLSGDTKMRRELVKGTLEVYRIGDYGAVEVGVHRFYTAEKGQPERLTATAKFVHLWKNQDNSWKLARVISYDHR